ncbi:MAG: FadR family transcriptional regulator, partial [Anaerolineae bacterium]|nr:FadR family transcriptional regulator [Anaerolineae bacterium]
MMSDQKTSKFDTNEESLQLINPINRMTIVDEIVERLIDLIVKGDLKPGDKLPPERELRNRLSVGRSSLREATKTLQALGVLEVKPGLGMFVSQGDIASFTKPLALGLFLNQGNVQQVIEARSVIEVALAGWAAERATEEDIALIGELLEKLTESQVDMDAYVDYDMKFHFAIAKAAKNEMLLYTLRVLHSVIRTWMETTYQESKGAVDSMELHTKIYNAICARDVKTAREIMAAHTSG